MRRFFDWEKDPDIMDVWFDSGSTWSAVCRERPAIRNCAR